MSQVGCGVFAGVVGTRVNGQGSAPVSTLEPLSDTFFLPGAQALLGFQLTVTLTEAFADLSSGAKMTHAAALCCIGLAVVLLNRPIHRISFGGQDDLDFLKIGSLLVVAAPLPLAVGISLDTYVAAGRALQSDTAALLLAAAALMTPLIFWYALPAWRRFAS
jgi:hypothetical protein